MIPIKGYDGLYELSDTGAVYAIPRKMKDKNGEIRTIRGGYLKQRVGIRGYFIVNLWKDGKFKTVNIHSLLAKHFIPNLYNKPTVNHIDGNKLNNNLSNLEWATYSEQLYHAHRTGLNKSPSLKSSLNGHAKKISQMDMTGSVIKVWDCARDADRCGFDYKAISACVTGKRKVYNNSIWSYA